MTLTIDGEVISDDTVVILNGDEAVATVWNPNEDPDFGGEIGSERIARLVKAKEAEPQTIVGLDADTGEQSTWVVSKGRGCRGC